MPPTRASTLTSLSTPRVAHTLTALTALSAFALASCAPTDAETDQSTDEVVVCAHGSTVLGVDVSSWQGGAINWPAVKRGGYQFAVARISDGTYIDSDFAHNWAGIRAAGLIRGSYQFFRPGTDPTVQANIVVSHVGHLGAGDLPVTLDMEVTDGQSAATIASRIGTWMARVQAGTGKVPIIYTGKYFWDDNVRSTAFSAHPLWIAAYGPTCPNLPTAWHDWRIFQFSDGQPAYSPSPVPGIGQSCDRDRFNGTLADLQTFADATPPYAARYVGQSFPLASAGAVQVHAGQTVTAWIDMRNVGSRAWNTNTRLATTMPRDRSSAFVGPGWLSPRRPAEVRTTTNPNGVARFSFNFHAPETMRPGTYTEHFGIVQEGTAWFSDPGQGGPADDQLEARIQVLAPLPPPDSGVHDAGTDAAVVHDGGAAGDAGDSQDDAAIPSDDANDQADDVFDDTDPSLDDVPAADDGGVDDTLPAHAGNEDGGVSDGAREAGSEGGTMVQGSCGCSTPGHGTRGGELLALSGIAAVVTARRRRPRAS